VATEYRVSEIKLQAALFNKTNQAINVWKQTKVTYWNEPRYIHAPVFLLGLREDNRHPRKWPQTPDSQIHPCTGHRRMVLSASAAGPVCCKLHSFVYSILWWDVTSDSMQNICLICKHYYVWYIYVPPFEKTNIYTTAQHATPSDTQLVITKLQVWVVAVPLHTMFVGKLFTYMPLWALV